MTGPKQLEDNKKKQKNFKQYNNFVTYMYYGVNCEIKNKFCHISKVMSSTGCTTETRPEQMYNFTSLIFNAVIH